MDWFPVLVALVALFLVFLYNFYKQIFHFRKHGIPLEIHVPLLGSAWRTLLRMESFSEAGGRIYNTYPEEAKYVGMYDLMTPVIMLRDPELIKTVLVKNFDQFPEHRTLVNEEMDPLFGKNLFALRGERWREVRNLLSPVFTSSKMKAMFKLMSQCGAEFADYMLQLPPSERTLEMKDVCTRYTNDVIATCAFGIEVNSMKDRNNPFYVYGREATNFGGLKSLKFFLVRGMPNVCQFLGVKLFDEKITNFFEDLVASTIKTRDEKGIVRPDMIQQMMENREKANLSILDMTAQAFIFFFGGFESTATTMCFAAHEICVNPDVQKKLQEEIDGVLADNNGDVPYEALNDMKYLDAVVNETLRMYPIAPMLDRKCVKHFELPPTLPGTKPYVLKPDSYVWVGVYGMHRDPTVFDDPDKFNPDRFLYDSKKILNSGKYLPFGLGPRMCIGNRFALLEVKVLLFHLLARCDLKPCSKTSIPIRITRKSLSMTAEDGFWMTIERRTNTHPSLGVVANGKSHS